MSDALQMTRLHRLGFRHSPRSVCRIARCAFVYKSHLGKGGAALPVASLGWAARLTPFSRRVRSARPAGSYWEV